MEGSERKVISALRQRASEQPRRIIFPEGEDPRVLEAANTLVERGWCLPIVCDPNPATKLRPGVETVSASDPQWMERTAQQLVENRKQKGMDFDTAIGMVSNPLLFATLLVRAGFADGSVAGSLAATASVIRAGLYGVGTAANNQLVSSFFLMQLPGRAVTFADCGVVPDPDKQALAEIAVAAARNHALLTGEKPKVALLSFSTKGSASHEIIDKVVEATALAQALAPDLDIDGELQFDAAWVPDVAARKAPNSSVAGEANVLIFPDLASGNIAYKITERLAGAQALGPLVQGLRQPCMDLSRGCSVEDIIDVAVIASIMASAGS